MRILIIEDELAASERLKAMLAAFDEGLIVEGVLQSVEEALHYLKYNDPPDVAFVDIQLADDSSFSIFETIEVHFPIIFTTAYDEYILEALEHNAIDYLLKPIDQDRLLKALEKVKKLESHFIRSKLSKLFNGERENKKKRFLVKKGTDVIPVLVEQIAYFFTEHKLVFLKDRNNVKYIVDKTIADITEGLGPQFFRVNRKYVVHIDAIEKFKSDNGKIHLSLQPPTTEVVTVSKENAPNFRKWIAEQ